MPLDVVDMVRRRLGTAVAWSSYGITQLNVFLGSKTLIEAGTLKVSIVSSSPCNYRLKYVPLDVFGTSSS